MIFTILIELLYIPILALLSLFPSTLGNGVDVNMQGAILTFTQYLNKANHFLPVNDVLLVFGIMFSVETMIILLRGATFFYKRFRG